MPLWRRTPRLLQRLLQPGGVLSCPVLEAWPDLLLVSFYSLQRNGGGGRDRGGGGDGDCDGGGGGREVTWGEVRWR